MSMIFISIQIKFDIDINYDELLETVWEHNNRKKKMDHCWYSATMQSPSLGCKVV
jgi:hypothetical protein